MNIIKNKVNDKKIRNTSDILYNILPFNIKKQIWNHYSKSEKSIPEYYILLYLLRLTFFYII